MIILTVDEIITLHSKLIAATVGSDGLRDKGLLESAVLNCYQTFGGEELYPGVIDRSLDYEVVLAWVRLHLSAQS